MEVWKSIRWSTSCTGSSLLSVILCRWERWYTNLFGKLYYFIFRKKYLNFTAEQIIDEAQKGDKSEKYVLEDFAKESFQKIVKCWNEDKKVSLSGRKSLFSYYISLIQTRKKLKEYITKHPEVLEIPIEKPLFIIGWPRVGSTFLHNLLATDKNSSSFLLYELMFLLKTETHNEVDERIKLTDETLASFYNLEPELYMLHEMHAKNPDECCHLFENSFIDRHSPIVCENIEEYSNLLYNRKKEEMIEFYKYYKTILQIILHQRNQNLEQLNINHFILKDSTHMLYVDSLLEVFPDANIIHLYRNPNPVFSSCYAGFCLVARFYYEVSDIDLNAVYNQLLEYMKQTSSAFSSARKKIESTTNRNVFFDLLFDDLIASPLGKVKEMYEFFGIEFNDQLEENINQFLVDYANFRKKTRGLIVSPTYSISPSYSHDQMVDLFGDYYSRLFKAQDKKN